MKRRPQNTTCMRAGPDWLRLSLSLTESLSRGDIASPHETRLRIPATEPWLNSTISPSALLTFTS